MMKTKMKMKIKTKTKTMDDDDDDGDGDADDDDDDDDDDGDGDADDDDDDDDDEEEEEEDDDDDGIFDIAISLHLCGYRSNIENPQPKLFSTSELQSEMRTSWGTFHLIAELLGILNRSAVAISHRGQARKGAEQKHHLGSMLKRQLGSSQLITPRVENKLKKIWLNPLRATIKVNTAIISGQKIIALSMVTCHAKRGEDIRSHFS